MSLQMKLCIIGDEKVGKSSLFQRYLHNKFNENYEPTTGLEFGKKSVGPFSLHIYDTSCSLTFKSITNHTLKDSAGIILLYDVTSKSSFQSLKQWAKDIKTYANPSLINSDVLLVGAKSDSSDRVLNPEDGQELAKSMGWSFLECSAKQNTNIKEIFEYFTPNNEEEEMTEMEYINYQKAQRRMRKEKELYYFGKAITYLFYLYIFGLLLTIGLYLNLEKQFNYVGTIEDSCQDLQTLNDINNKIYPLIDELTYKKFFRIFRVNLDNDCPFQVGEFICTSKKCVICTCNTTEIPENWLLPQSAPVKSPRDDFAFWESERFSSPYDWIWHVEDLANDKGVYVDLKLNPEAYTGYQGQHIWDVIYHENCYQGNVENMCKEERALNKLLSGLHTSISTQLSEYYVDLVKNVTYPNYPVYFTKVGNHPDRIKNLFFIYSVLLRSIILASEGIQGYDINSLSFEDDLRSKQIINEILSIANSQCSMPFDEQSFFKEITFEHKKQYQRYIHNISQIMDCVECQKCRVFGKMQTYGVGTAFKILFSESPSEFSGRLKRNELVALLNTFGKISSSVKSLELMYSRRVKYHENIFFTVLVCGGMMLIFLIAMKKIYTEMDKKINKMFQHIPFDPAKSQRKSQIQPKIKRD